MIRCKGQIETCHICNKPGHKGVKCNENFDKQWPRLSDGISKRKIRTYAKISDKSPKLQKEKQENEVVLCTDEKNASTFNDTKQNEEHVHIALAESTHDCSSNEKKCDWFEQVNAKETLWEAIKQQKKTVKDTDQSTMTMIIEFAAFQNAMKINKGL